MVSSQQLADRSFGKYKVFQYVLIITYHFKEALKSPNPLCALCLLWVLSGYSLKDSTPRPLRRHEDLKVFFLLTPTPFNKLLDNDNHLHYTTSSNQYYMI